MKKPFQQNITDSRKFYSTKKLVLSSARVFCKNSLIVVCCTFGKLEIKNLTQKQFKNQANDTLKLLECNCNHQKGFVKLKMLLSIIVVLSQNSLNTFIRISILDKLCQCNNCDSIETTLDQIFMYPQQHYYAQPFGYKKNECSPQQQFFTKIP